MMDDEFSYISSDNFWTHFGPLAKDMSKELLNRFFWFSELEASVIDRLLEKVKLFCEYSVGNEYTCVLTNDRFRGEYYKYVFPKRSEEDVTLIVPKGTVVRKNGLVLIGYGRPFVGGEKLGRIINWYAFSMAVSKKSKYFVPAVFGASFVLFSIIGDSLGYLMGLLPLLFYPEYTEKCIKKIELSFESYLNSVKRVDCVGDLETILKEAPRF